MGCFNTVWSKAKTKVQSWHKTEFIGKKVRDPIFGHTISICITEVVAYCVIRQDVRVGALPVYMPYLLISIVAMFETVLAPIVSWYGYKTRKRVLLGWSIALILASLTWCTMPSHTKLEETEFCDSSTPNTNILFVSLSVRTAVRMMVTIFVAISFCLARVAIWSHYIAYTDDHDPNKTTTHFGILVVVRVLFLLFSDELFTSSVDTSVMIHVSIMSLASLVNLAKIYFFVPNTNREAEAAKDLPPMKGRGFFQSSFRVLCNVLAMSQMLAMGLLVTAVFGLTFYEGEIIKTKFNISLTNASAIDVDSLRYILAILAVVYVGVKHSSPIRSQYEIDRGLKQIFKMTLITFILYVIITTLPQCKKGHIAGLENSSTYTQPICSLSCGCIPKWQEYSPVCVVDTMTTYLSPCEAGCTESYTINNLKVYSNCSCAGPSGQIAPGACGDFNCRSGYNFHIVVYGLIVTTSILAFQSQGMVILKSVDPRDKSIAIGIMWSVVATIAFICGNNIFMSVAVKTCSWYTGDNCQLYQQRFTYIIGFTCAALAFIALAINLVAKWYLKSQNRLHRNENNREEDNME